MIKILYFWSNTVKVMNSLMIMITFLLQKIQTMAKAQLCRNLLQNNHMICTSWVHYECAPGTKAYGFTNIITMSLKLGFNHCLHLLHQEKFIMVMINSSLSFIKYIRKPYKHVNSLWIYAWIHDLLLLSVIKTKYFKESKCWPRSIDLEQCNQSITASHILLFIKENFVTVVTVLASISHTGQSQNGRHLNKRDFLSRVA